MGNGKDSIQILSFSNEIKISITCFKKGLVEFSTFGPTTSNLFVPLLLLSTGFERILKILYSLHYYDKNSSFPENKELKKYGHDIKKLLDSFVEVCSLHNIYRTSSARKEDIDYLKNNLDFKQLISIINDFSKSSRYYNLNFISEPKQNSGDSMEFIHNMQKVFRQRNPEIDKNIFVPPYNTQLLYDRFNPYIIELIQRSLRVFSYGFTQGAFGPLALQVSSGLMNDFLYIKEENLPFIKFSV